MTKHEGPDKLATRAANVISTARHRGITLATAESCTAGALANLLASAPGAGDVYDGGFAVYTKENKTKALGVAASLISRHSAVSAEVAKAMAECAIERCPADLAVSITCVAGPEPDEDGNPVGLVHIAVANRQGSLLHEEYHLGAQRHDEICAAAEDRALALIEKIMAQDAELAEF